MEKTEQILLNPTSQQAAELAQATAINGLALTPDKSSVSMMVTLPDVLPPIPPGDYWVSNLIPAIGQIVAGDLVSLHKQDMNSLTWQSGLQGNYNILDFVAEVHLPPGSAKNISLAAVCSAPFWIGQYLYVFNFITGKFQLMTYTNIGPALTYINIQSIGDSGSVISKDGIIRLRIYGFMGRAYTSRFDLMKVVVS